MQLMWLLVLVFCIFYKINEASSSCGYEDCSLPLDSYRINVHIIPHSHDDVGWIRSVGEYFSGVHAGVSVNNIISNVYEALKLHPSRTYTQVETAFFWKWWQLQTDEIRAGYRSLVENGQIEIANGGFSMNDEACVHYQSTIDQFTRGLRILNDTLGSCGAPKVGWQIDPFGHSREQSLIYRQLGFDGAFFARLEYNDRLLRIDQKRLDFLWKSSPNFADSEIFYGILKNHYGSPQGFCYNIMCDDEPINDDIDSFDYNGDRIKDGFEKVLDEFADSSTTKQILIPMGGDFNYESAAHQFMNIDRLIKLFRNHDKYNVFYSTPSCYLYGVHQSAPNISVKTDDFFPYADNEHAYWTGYYTSRPTSKRFERTAHKILQANKQLRSIFKLNRRSLVFVDSDPKLEELQDSLAIMQHHDAVSGTEKQKIANDYVNMLNKGIIKAEKDVGVIITCLLDKKDNIIYDSLKFSSCLLANISICENSAKDRFVIAVYNPLSKSVFEAVRLPVQDADFSVIGPDGKEIEDLDVVDPISDFSYVYLEGVDPSPKELVFAAKQIPPMSINLYYVSKKVKKIRRTEESVEDDNLVFGTKDLNFVLDSLTKKLKSVTMNGITQSITQDFYYYPSESGINNFVPSGAYLFRPESGTKEAIIVSGDNAVLEYSYKGKVVDEAHVRINDWIKQIIRVYKGGEDNYIEFDWMVGPINLASSMRIGQEVISRFTASNFTNNGVFYTDSNGRETIKRFRNRRVDYTYDPKIEPISSNYYPVTARIAMRDEAKQLEVAVFNDRSQGGSSLNDGELEIMVHRRVLVDDGKGLSEALNEYEFDQPLVVRGKHYLMIGSTGDNNVNGKGISFTAAQRDFQSKKHLSPYVLVADSTDRVHAYDKLKDVLNFQLQFLTQALPDNVNILTLERWRDEDDTYLLRLEHLLEKKEDLKLSRSVTVDIRAIFGNHKIEDIKETTLGANVWLKDYMDRPKKFVWTTDTNRTVNSDMERSSSLESNTDTKITLLPMEIRTFIIKMSS